jgi:hypothetical protein
MLLLEFGIGCKLSCANTSCPIGSENDTVIASAEIARMLYLCIFSLDILILLQCINCGIKSGKIYTTEEIEKAKQSPSFEREYNLKYLGKIGNVFHTKDIEEAIEKGRKYNQMISFHITLLLPDLWV